MSVRRLIALSVAGALLGLGTGVAALNGLPGRDAAGTALVLLAGAAAGLALGLVVAALSYLAARPRRTPAAPPEPARPAPEPEPEPAAPEWPPPADPAPGWHPDPAGGPGRRYWDGQAWTEHRWRDRAPR
jgi:hypothetical protein